MSNGLFGKVDALMRKHRGDSTMQPELPAPSERRAPPVDAWLPVLTDVIMRGSPPPVAETLQADAETDLDEPSSHDVELEGTDAVPRSNSDAAPVGAQAPSSESVAEPETMQAPATTLEDSAESSMNEHATENMVDELAPKISGLMQEQVAEELRKSLDQSMATLMANLNANVEEMVRQALAEKLGEKDKKPS
jgi:hypothetical protein